MPCAVINIATGVFLRLGIVALIAATVCVAVGCRPDHLTDGGTKAWRYVTPGWRDTTGRPAPQGALTLRANGRFVQKEDLSQPDADSGTWARRGDTLVLQFAGSYGAHRFIIRELTGEALLLDDGMGGSLRLRAR